MDYDRLCSWLGLPPGSWPPDHYALLGLARGTGVVTEIEARVLDRMEQIRPHQLLHPELVTDGMNRLAQALVCLTDPVARSAYDRSIGIPPPPFEVVEDEPQPESAKHSDGTRPIELPAEVPVEPQKIPYEVVEPPEREPDPLPYKIPPYEVVPDESRPTKQAYEVVEGGPPPPLPYEVIPPDEVPKSELPFGEPIELDKPAEKPSEEPHPPAPPAPISRRALYRQLAAIRKAMRAWEGLRPVFGTPTETLATPMAVLLFVRALADARDAIPDVSQVIQGPGSPGGMVAALIRLPHALHAVRVLLPVQREAIALDWRRGYAVLLHERRRLREMTLVARHRRPDASGQLLRVLRHTPEWILLFAVLTAALFTLLRRHP